jgi:hypothetical protein
VQCSPAGTSDRERIRLWFSKLILSGYMKPEKRRIGLVLLSGRREAEQVVSVIQDETADLATDPLFRFGGFLAKITRLEGVRRLALDFVPL